MRQLRIGSGRDATVVVIGGMHAREWAPPDALLSLAEGLVRAYADGGALDYPEWVDRSGRDRDPVCGLERAGRRREADSSRVSRSCWSHS